MGKHTRCIIGVCNNDNRYPERMVKHSNVTGSIVMHCLPKDKTIRATWVHHILKGRKDIKSEKDLAKNCYVCSNHFRDGKPTKENPSPSLFLTLSTNTLATPKSRKITKRVADSELQSKAKKQLSTVFTSPLSEHSYCSLNVDDAENIEEPEEPKFKDASVATEEQEPEPIPVKFAHITRECDVCTFTDLEGPEMFKAVFDLLKFKARHMTYWDGQKKTLRLRKRASSVELANALLTSPDYDLDPLLLPINKSGPSRKLSLEQELLLTLMKLRLNLLNDDLAFRFKISSGKVSQIFITWIKLMSKELSVLIIWPSRQQIRATLPGCFKKLFPKTRTIIDCSEVFMDTPSSLEVQACLWSDYRHHCTIKFLVCNTPNGAISWISPLYGGRTSDMYIVRDSGFLELLEPCDQVMADRGFKMKTDLALKQCTLSIPPSAAKGSQMVAKEVPETSNIANVHIYVEQAIRRMKELRMLKYQQPLLYLPIFNDILRVISALVNLKRPLAE